MATKAKNTDESVAVYSPTQFQWNGKLRTYNPDDLVHNKAKGLEIYKDMVRDPYVASSLEQLIFELLAVDYQIVPGSDPDAAAFVEWCLRTNIRGSFTRDIAETMDALRTGFSVAEKVFEYVATGPWTGKVALAALKHKDPEYIEFAPDEYGNLGTGSVIVTMTSAGASMVPFDADKFFIFSWNRLYENPYGQSRFRRAYRACWIKDTAWKLRSVYMERYSGNNLKAKIPRSKFEAEKENMRKLLAAWAQETGIVIPDDVEVEVLNLATSSVSEYQLTIADCNKEIIVGILGATLTVDEGRKTGARALGDVHADVKTAAVKFIDLYFTPDVNEQIIRPLVDMNFGPQAAYPRFQFTNRNAGTKEDADTLVVLVKDLGLKVAERDVYEMFRVRRPADGDTLLSPSPSSPTVKGGENNLPAATGTPPPSPSPAGGRGGQGGEGLQPKVDGVTFHGEPHTFTGSAPPSKFVRLSKPDEIAARLDALIVRAKEKAQPVYDKIKASILAQAEKVFASDKPDYIAASKIKVTDIGGLKEVFINSMLTASLRGRADMTAELIAQGWDKPAKLAEDGEIYNPDEALAAFTGQVAMTKAAYNIIASDVKKRAFYVAGLEKIRIEADLMPLVEQAIREGWNYKTFQHELDQMFIKYSTPVYGRVGSVGEKIYDYHAETIFRTNVMGAYNQARKEMMDEAGDFVPAREYSTGPRPRDSHAALDGKIYLTGDPIWESIYPPWEPNCNCTVVPVNKYEFTPDMLSKSPAVTPDAGFGG